MLVPLLVPVFLSALALLAVTTYDGRGVAHKATVWVISILVCTFCVLGIWSVGVFYLPTALALVFSAVVFSRSPRLRATT